MAVKKATAKPAEPVEKEAAGATQQDAPVAEQAEAQAAPAPEAPAADDKPAADPVPPAPVQDQANGEQADMVVLVVNRERLEHDGVPYGMGEPIELTYDQAKPLLAIGAVQFGEAE
ncbi:hypothetical protein [Halopseudomonas aestusnigri]|uniref:Uncharacterized protein n=1 Tax=Halopseudomonas aestusnigri TaxID=857252 RepID=A0AAQ1GA88_9GAMM|nr:hypothetical protein [Halopseudomonas aestusnigri]OWL84579.1 hypothetical protein B7O88_16145 [Halopseudomonas aestusnigri]SEG70326.1 hypothetical protein SAMN05216586_11661 [Halopseudomonas aestusnigri]